MTMRVKYTVIWKELKLLSFLVDFVLIQIITSTSFPQLFAMSIMIIQII